MRANTKSSIQRPILSVLATGAAIRRGHHHHVIPRMLDEKVRQQRHNHATGARDDSDCSLDARGLRQRTIPPTAMLSRK